MELLQQCYNAYALIKQHLDTIYANREAFTDLALRCGALQAPLGRLKSNDGDTTHIDSKKRVLERLVIVMRSIGDFMAQSRFHIDPKKWLTKWFHENKYAASDKAQLAKLHAQLNVAVADLQLGVQVDTEAAMTKRFEEACIKDDSYQQSLMQQFCNMTDLMEKNFTRMDELQGLITRMLSLAEDREAINEQKTDNSATSPTHGSASISTLSSSNVPTKSGNSYLLPEIDHSELIAEFRKQDLLGSGSFSEVYRGSYGSVDCAIKKFSNYDASLKSTIFYEGIVKNIQREAAIMHSASAHPSVLRFFGVSLEKGYIVMELAQASLCACLYYDIDKLPSTMRHYRYDLIAVLTTVQQIAGALKFLHTFQITHRDLKPDNVMMVHDASRNKIVAKLSDFGLSHMVGISTTTSAGSAKRAGTLHYKAPELFPQSKKKSAFTNSDGRKKMSFSPASDMYAFGVLINELRTGQLPWADSTESDIIYSIIDDERPTKEELWKIGHIPTAIGIQQAVVPSLSVEVQRAATEVDQTLHQLVGNSNMGCFAKDPAIRPTAFDIIQTTPFAALQLALQTKQSTSTNSTKTAIVPKLPAGWAEYITSDGKPYFHNAATGSTSWIAPQDDGLLPKSNIKLPAGWVEYFSSDGKPYFHNAATGSTSWIAPQDDGPNFNVLALTVPFSTYNELKEAVDMWCTNKNQALHQFGPISNWNVSLITDMEELFKDKADFNDDISTWDVSNVTNMTKMFKNATAFNCNISHWNVSNVTNMGLMFDACSAFNQPIGSWNVSNVVNMEFMFSATLQFNQPLGNWNMKNVCNIQGMFYDAVCFNQPIGKWDISKVTSTAFLFQGAAAFNQPIADWNMSNITNIRDMFLNAVSFNQPIGNWDVSKVENMEGLFHSAAAFNQPIGNWDTSNVVNMFCLFHGTTFNQPIGNWNVSKVKNMGLMFYQATEFNQPIGDWNVSNVDNMDSMFLFASAFNQPIAGWDVSKVTNMDNMFLASGLGASFKFRC